MTLVILLSLVFLAIFIAAGGLSTDDEDPGPR